MFHRITSPHAIVRPLIAALCAGALTVVLAPFAAASGNVVHRSHDTLRDSHIEQETHEFCDVPFLVRWDGRVTITETIIARGGGELEYFSIHISAEDTFTNVETGASFRAVDTFNGRDQKLTLNADGTLTVEFMDRFSSKLFGSDGKLVGVDAGTIAGTVVVDLGDPEDPEDDTLLSETITRDHGTRTFGERDFCQDVLDFLG
jgi:hypothetical protein